MRRKVEDIYLSKGMTVNELVRSWSKSGGFMAKHIADAVDILEEMQRSDCLKFLSFPACIVATGTRGVIVEALKRGMFDAVVTTCGTIDHDLARIWREYYHGSFDMDDVELFERGLHRLGNIVIPVENYGIILEKKLQELFKKLKLSGRISGVDLLWRIGDILVEEGADDSILYWCAKRRIPIFIPGITDGAFGFQLFMYRERNRDFTIDILKDEEKLSEIVFNQEKTGALIVGGGISKHHTIWWNQFKDGLDYAIYITSAVEWDGSLSGARMREAVSWGKVGRNARYITIWGDATVILPLVLASVIERLET